MDIFLYFFTCFYFKDNRVKIISWGKEANKMNKAKQANSIYKVTKDKHKHIRVNAVNSHGSCDIHGESTF